MCCGEERGGRYTQARPSNSELVRAGAVNVNNCYLHSGEGGKGAVYGGPQSGGVFNGAMAILRWPRMLLAISRLLFLNKINIRAQLHRTA